MEQKTSSLVGPTGVISAIHGFRYQVKDVARAGVLHPASWFHTEAPTASGVCQCLVGRRGCPSKRSRSLWIAPDAEWRTSGARWVEPCGAEGGRPPACIAELKSAGITLRNEMEAGPGGRQIQIEDPDGESDQAVRAGSLIDDSRFDSDEGDRDAHECGRPKVCLGFEPQKRPQSSDGKRLNGCEFLWLGVRDSNWVPRPCWNTYT